jgi:hypothetical protein
MMSASRSTGRQTDALLEANDLYRFYHAGEDETFALRGVSLSTSPTADPSRSQARASRDDLRRSAPGCARAGSGSCSNRATSWIT